MIHLLDYLLCGNISLLNEKTIGIVGCREASDYGRKVAYEFSLELSARNFVIISGMAKGIDSYAHLGALKSSGKTIAILGCGVNIVYPKENIDIYNSILAKGGLVVSEYLISTSPLKKHFPERNRIISGISQSVLVVEAKERSGTLITVDFALEQGKDIYSIPGNIFSVNSYSTNELIKQGAKMVTKVDDIIEDYL